jgi:predicted outer membrane repeat protein
MRNPSCPTITWNKVLFNGNTAGGDGGAMYLAEMSKRVVNCRDSSFASNRVRAGDSRPPASTTQLQFAGWQGGIARGISLIGGQL